MPVRIRKIHHDEYTKAKIKASNIITRLQKHINGEIEMVPSAVTAALGLLKKVVPDLTSVEHSGEISTPSVIRAPMIAETEDEWNQHVPPEHRTEH
jgi:hypothetical protein